ncbi:hypothetical protein PMIN01_08228 [Paraphaeosphaeria minitans]|uniref:Uncharacterized protein n=1 Tax=Paraphaeosphaeria minitans TaxID=565426 RepID=A0A9P6KPC9_9PLEO|nr:hypothetical protein PMIN01_08162 [Paraphaeosphaeria minitans]KAF9733885.1 hypothetical protein PMIN01_08228 [Paraphaeosphaeria minitans]
MLVHVWCGPGSRAGCLYAGGAPLRADPTLWVRPCGPSSRAGCLHAGGASLRAGPTFAGLEVRPLSPCTSNARTPQFARAGELSVRSIHPHGHIGRSANARTPKQPVPGNPMRSTTPHPSFVPRRMRPHSLISNAGTARAL